MGAGRPGACPWLGRGVGRRVPIGQPAGRYASASELWVQWAGVQWAQSPLNPTDPQIVSTCGGPDIARSVSSPLLSREAVGFLRGHLVPKEMALWDSLGETWTRPRYGTGRGGRGGAQALLGVHPAPPTPAPSGPGSRRCLSTCPSSTVAGSPRWTCCRRPPGKQRGWHPPPLTRSEHRVPIPPVTGWSLHGCPLPSPIQQSALPPALLAWSPPHTKPRRPPVPTANCSEPPTLSKLLEAQPGT